METQAKHSKRRAKAAIRDAEILQLRAIMRLTFQQIADKLGMSKAGVFKAYKRAVTMQEADRAKLGTAVREGELALIDKLQQAVIKKALQGDPKAQDQVRKGMKQRAELLGLNAPVKIEAKVVSDAELDKVLRQLPEAVQLAILEALAGASRESGKGR